MLLVLRNYCVSDWEGLVVGGDRWDWENGVSICLVTHSHAIVIDISGLLVDGFVRSPISSRSNCLIIISAISLKYISFDVIRIDYG